MLKITHPPTSLSVKDVTVRYSNGHTAIHDVSFHLEGGTICALLGVNGSGKSPSSKALWAWYSRKALSNFAV